MIMTIFSGCGLLQKLGLEKSDNDEMEPVSSVAINEAEAKKLNSELPIRLYFANQDNTKLQLEVRYIPLEEAKKSVNNQASLIVKELINGPTGKNAQATIPKGTKLRSPVSINGNVATVDLTKEFIENHPGGKSEAQMTIYSIVNSLTELKDIEKVKFTIDGAAKADFKGVIQLNAVFPRTEALISKEVPPAANDKGTTDKKDTKTDTKAADTKSTTKDTKTIDTTKKSSTSDTSKDSTSKASTKSDKATSTSEDDSEATYLDESGLLE
jgi:hypothetical protein